MTKRNRTIAACPALLWLAGCGASAVAPPLADSPQWLDAQKTAQFRDSGEKLGRAQAEDVERWLADHPDDQVAREKLLLFYAANGTRFYDPAVVVAARRKHILWMIAHHPEDPLLRISAGLLSPPPQDPIADPAGYQQGKKLWLATAAKPGVPAAALSNAAEFLAASDPAIAEKLLLQAHDSTRLGKLYGEALSSPDADYAAQARQKLDDTRDAEVQAAANGARVRAHHPADGSPDALALKAQADYDNGDYETARKGAEDALTRARKSANDPDAGTAVFRAHMILGLAAMQAGDRKSAVKDMLDAAESPASEELQYTVPDIAYRLPAWLLKDGERETVIQFLETFAKTSLAGRKSLLESAALIRRNEKPAWYPR